ncbi:DUF488 domain-containing protein [Leucobacter soli]|uniref:DUF488 family protein n=1 Tax=Leucobacter soli TaxID=2812850 RepID=A0A916NP77_9MICO|nr:DUF488 family protein [Leucobacter soli]CAG7612482.1 hypothetical protein LEUCIP111803_01571 [Leucobacter soli]
MEVAIKRIYAPAEPSDGMRVLVDRLWPRGVSKADAQLDLWAKDVAPSPALRTAWHHDPDGHEPSHFAAFAAEYRAELGEEPALASLQQLAATAREHDRLTLLYGAKDEQTNHAVVLREALLELLGTG